MANAGRIGLRVATLGPNILGSFIAGLVGMPILYFWLSKAVPRERRA